MVATAANVKSGESNAFLCAQTQILNFNMNFIYCISHLECNGHITSSWRELHLSAKKVEKAEQVSYRCTKVER